MNEKNDVIIAKIVEPKSIILTIVDTFNNRINRIEDIIQTLNDITNGNNELLFRLNNASGKDINNNTISEPMTKGDKPSSYINILGSTSDRLSIIIDKLQELVSSQEVISTNIKSL